MRKAGFSLGHFLLRRKWRERGERPGSHVYKTVQHASTQHPPSTRRFSFWGCPLFYLWHIRDEEGCFSTDNQVICLSRPRFSVLHVRSSASGTFYLVISVRSHHLRAFLPWVGGRNSISNKWYLKAALYLINWWLVAEKIAVILRNLTHDVLADFYQKASVLLLVKAIIFQNYDPSLGVA